MDEKNIMLMKEMAKEPCCKPMNKKLAKVLFSKL